MVAVRNGGIAMDAKEKELIEKMCECDMNVTKVAKAMYMHRNTVTYHIAKIRKKTGLDPMRFYDLVKLREMINEVSELAIVEKWLQWEDAEEWGEIECPMLDGQKVMTYIPKGAPAYYSMTAPFVEDGDVCYYRYDHDEGCWDEDTIFVIEEYQEGTVYRLA